MQPTRLRRLEALLARPTAPFHEDHVAAHAARQLDRWQVPWCSDPYGNLVVGVPSLAGYRRILNRPGPPLRILIAHMDHPGFQGRTWLGLRRLAVRWLGGGPTRRLSGARVWVVAGGGTPRAGRLTRARPAAHGFGLESAEVVLEAPLPGRRPAARLCYGGFDFGSPVRRRGPRLYTRAADDLVGVFTILELARGLRRDSDLPFLGLLSRAEEVGFVGLLAHLEAGYLARTRRPVVCVSLEASRTLPGAELGRGPVVRLGDRRSTFDPHATKVLADLARRVLPGAHQERIMDGGACEASAALAHGLPTIGLSVPLGNYHNQPLETGGPGPAPEFVHPMDVDGLLRLCTALVRRALPWSDPWCTERGRLTRNARHYRRLLARPLTPGHPRR